MSDTVIVWDLYWLVDLCNKFLIRMGIFTDDRDAIRSQTLNSNGTTPWITT